MPVMQVCRGVVETGDLVVGDQIGRRSTFTDEDGVATNPATVTCEVEDPSGTVHVVIPVNESPGVYLSTFPVFHLSGPWKWIVQGAGGINAVEQGKFRVKAQLF